MPEFSLQRAFPSISNAIQLSRRHWWKSSEVFPPKIRGICACWCQKCFLKWCICYVWQQQSCCLFEMIARSQDPAAGEGGRAGEWRQRGVRTAMKPRARVPCYIVPHQNFTCFQHSLLPFTAAVISFGNVLFKDFHKKPVSCLERPSEMPGGLFVRNRSLYNVQCASLCHWSI